MTSLREEFQLRNFGFNYDKPYKFTVSQWRGLPDGFFVGWRVFWGLWHIGWLIRSIHAQIDLRGVAGSREYRCNCLTDEVHDSDLDPGESAKWFIYLTNWCYLMLTIQAVLHMCIVVQSRCSHNGKPPYVDGATNPWYNKALWLFTDISFPAAIVVSIFFWTLVFEELDFALTVMTHGVTTLYFVTDMFISAFPIRILHVIYPVIYGIIYLLFSVVYHLADGTNNDFEPYIYSSLDWSDTGATAGLAVGVAFVAAPLAHLFVFGLYTLRSFIHQNCSGKVTPEDKNDGK